MSSKLLRISSTEANKLILHWHLKTKIVLHFLTNISANVTIVYSEVRVFTFHHPAKVSTLLPMTNQSKRVTGKDQYAHQCKPPPQFKRYTFLLIEFFPLLSPKEREKCISITAMFVQFTYSL